MQTRVLIIGGGAAGFFLAANLNSKLLDVCLIEQSSQYLQKVKISGGGRCNLTHACFDPSELTGFYPRGAKELRSVFHGFQPGDSIAWFEERGLELKTEADGRMFPVSDKSEDVIAVLMHAAKINKTKIYTNESLLEITKNNTTWQVKSTNQTWHADVVVFCTGSAARPLKLIENLGHKVEKAVPSLFTFNIKNPILEGLMGTSFPNVHISLPDLKLEESGPMLITHWGISGPAVLKLSSWGARLMAAKNYQFDIYINFINESAEDCIRTIFDFREKHPKKSLYTSKIFDFSNRFWVKCLSLAQISEKKINADLTKNDVEKLAQILCKTQLKVKGRSVNKDEFVTAGGVSLKEINFKNMQSKIHDNLFFAGEILDIDALTGGFNFQACWSEAYLIANHLNQIEKI